MEVAVIPPIEWAVASSPKSGEPESGDRYWVSSTSQGTLVAVIDGLGHGAEAAQAAEVALRQVERHGNESMISLFEHCHENLRHTRGAVMSAAVFNVAGNTMTWMGVGNVAGRLLRARLSPHLRCKTLHPARGVLGGRLPPLFATTLPVAPGDILILVSDGIRGGFEEDLALGEPAQRMANRILGRYALATDDALVVVARYRGSVA